MVSVGFLIDATYLAVSKQQYEAGFGAGANGKPKAGVDENKVSLA